MIKGNIVKGLFVGVMGSNCYMVGTEKEVVLIDAGVTEEQISKALQRANLNLGNIIITHGHVDHIYYLNDIYKVTGAKISIHERDYPMLGDPEKNFSKMFGENICFKWPVQLLKDGDTLQVDGLNFEIIHTPGHSGGSICIKVLDNLFTGDTIFNGTIGRTDMPGSNFDEMRESIKKIMCLDDNIVIYPGHGEMTTIGEERRRPYMSHL